MKSFHVLFTISAVLFAAQISSAASCPEGLDECNAKCDRGCTPGMEGSGSCGLTCRGLCKINCLIPKGGCYQKDPTKGKYCWAACATGIPGLENEWCYTTQGPSILYPRVLCSVDSQCDPTWKCAGLCTV
ncbi:MAG: hypothetical protein J3R72DRAFT_463637 [Linnemannia gamsii]|nr:MAG: hypothetical protein J3R72DRAFT_463637 [Linnemannia gamsii]